MKGKVRITVSEPIGPKQKQRAIKLETAARWLERQADETSRREPLKEYALRKAACYFRMQALLIRRHRGEPIIAAVNEETFRARMQFGLPAGPINK